MRHLLPLRLMLSPNILFKFSFVTIFFGQKAEVPVSLIVGQLLEAFLADKPQNQKSLETTHGIVLQRIATQRVFNKNTASSVSCLCGHSENLVRNHMYSIVDQRLKQCNADEECRVNRVNALAENSIVWLVSQLFISICGMEIVASNGKCWHTHTQIR